MATKDKSGPRILFADQDVVLCVSVRRALHQHGYAVTLVHDGGDAIDFLGRETFDLVVAGTTLPTLNGMRVLRVIKQQGGETPVILLGELSSSESELAQKEGAYACVSIPTDDFKELIQSIDRALAAPEPMGLRLDGAETSPARHSLDETRLLGLLRNLIESTRTSHLEETKQLLLQATATAMNAEHSVILSTVEGTGLQMDSALGFADQAAAARDFVTHVGETFAWRVSSESKTLIEHNPAVEGQPSFWFIGTPLSVRNQMLGVLIVYPLSDDTVEPERVNWFELLAAQGAIAIYLSQLGAENDRLVQTDPVTGALQSVVFLDLADHEFRRSWRYSQPISAIILDVDGMSEINTRSGREFGDRVLHEVANTCRGVVRSIDLVGRSKDDAFALLLLMTDHAGAKRVAERLREGVRAIELSDARGPVHVSATLGVCAYPRENCASIFDLLAVALDAQRSAHRSGPNQIVAV
jgi:diguanylate cyclase (GGDEF)-like protein